MNTDELDQLPPGTADFVARWCTQTVAEADEQERRLDFDTHDRLIDIYELLAPSQPTDGHKWVRFPIAQLEYHEQAPQHLAWTLQCADENGEWYAYEDFRHPGTAFTGTLDDALADIEEDREGKFFGTF